MDQEASLNSISCKILLDGNLFLSKETLELSKLMNILIELYYLKPLLILSTSLEALITHIS